MSDVVPGVTGACTGGPQCPAERHRHGCYRQTGAGIRRGVQWCMCKPRTQAHVYEPGEWCSPTLVVPTDEQMAAAGQ